MNAHPAYRLYYVIHEACHCFVGHGHTSAFLKLEAELLEQEDLRIIRRSDRNVYPKELRKISTGEKLCGPHGEPFVNPLPIALSGFLPVESSVSVAA